MQNAEEGQKESGGKPGEDQAKIEKIYKKKTFFLNNI